MKEDDDQDDESSPRQSTTLANSPRAFHSKSKTAVNPTKSLVRFQEQRTDDRRDSQPALQERFASASRSEPRKQSKPLPAASEKAGGVYEVPQVVVSDCWKTTSGEVPVELVELYNVGQEEDWGGRARRRKAEEDASGGTLEVLSSTKEFHVLSEIQKERILTVMEDAIKKLANSEFTDFCQQEEQSRGHENSSFHAGGVNVEKYFCKKLLLPWVLMKVIEMIVCHIIQLTFLSNDSYFQRKSEFLPVVVTFYLTLFIITFSLIMHIVCFSYGGVQHPCYFMCVVSSSILALTTSLGVLIMLCSMDYYQTFREILVLVFVGTLLCSLVVELCICYVEVKTFWNRVRNTECLLS